MMYERAFIVFWLHENSKKQINCLSSTGKQQMVDTNYLLKESHTLVSCFNKMIKNMRTTEQESTPQVAAPPVPDKLHPTVQAFIDKKVEQARESLKGADLSVIRRTRKGDKG